MEEVLVFRIQRMIYLEVLCAADIERPVDLHVSVKCACSTCGRAVVRYARGGYDPVAGPAIGTKAWSPCSIYASAASAAIGCSADGFKTGPADPRLGSAAERLQSLTAFAAIAWPAETLYTSTSKCVGA